MVGRNSKVLLVVIRGTLTWYATVSIQNLAVMTAACALAGPAASGGRVVIVACVPARKEMLAVPPPFIVALLLGTVSPVETSKVMVSLMSRPWMARWRCRLGFLMISVVRVPAAMNLRDYVSCVRTFHVVFFYSDTYGRRSCGILGVSSWSAFWDAKVILFVGCPMGKGVVSRTAKAGPLDSPPSAVFA